MNRNKLNYLVDLGLAISFFSVFITGLIKFPGLIRVIGRTNQTMLKAMPIAGIKKNANM